MPSQKTVSCGGLLPFDGWKIEWSVRRFLHRCMWKRGEIGPDEFESAVKNWGEDFDVEPHEHCIFQDADDGICLILLMRYTEST